MKKMFFHGLAVLCLMATVMGGLQAQVVIDPEALTTEDAFFEPLTILPVRSDHVSTNGGVFTPANSSAKAVEKKMNTENFEIDYATATGQEAVPTSIYFKPGKFISCNERVAIKPVAASTIARYKYKISISPGFLSIRQLADGYWIYSILGAGQFYNFSISFLVNPVDFTIISMEAPFFFNFFAICNFSSFLI
jgi:hypothetical protein